ncbi:MAG: hypothetical protein A2504_06405 [Bdellovibrionales bacterium RIFOXYD12_FULL_39_22]|nr:MAG: hypothetical protein A2385_08725 [Bdellovibrionales bacterium RIFOXYB1_FULL_39_21]OFZ45211.1 MAG: hypothetical protein A2485_05805 [Bdellovibrionales bacterium RIFOXYC12_FULL_39_17]OFZ45596.1 MAG: hypothetical protein A2404_03305 [Bdellovibrionales bacterium RIFOXYC1_FULL_39_130]OFZ77458.1 MAG: hypothetical protein A2560_08895 [Bdellovibrionales bacterium RIFOXYD1_FULL_39_84]OFZ91587.1 MAG: hypothetical protein A2504_06405 [Bdellovibrionales bacterium RIFOXYD12_FULL_39_22]HLE11954.1 hy
MKKNYLFSFLIALPILFLSTATAEDDFSCLGKSGNNTFPGKFRDRLFLIDLLPKQEQESQLRGTFDFIYKALIERCDWSTSLEMHTTCSSMCSSISNDNSFEGFDGIIEAIKYTLPQNPIEKIKIICNDACLQAKTSMDKDKDGKNQKTIVEKHVEMAKARGIRERDAIVNTPGFCEDGAMNKLNTQLQKYQAEDGYAKRFAPSLLSIYKKKLQAEKELNELILRIPKTAAEKGRKNYLENVIVEYAKQSDFLYTLQAEYNGAFKAEYERIYSPEFITEHCGDTKKINDNSEAKNPPIFEKNTEPSSQGQHK